MQRVCAAGDGKNPAWGGWLHRCGAADLRGNWHGSIP
jgi:hypothetical protein